jgi:GWxTD domain-containing protein
VEVPFSNLEFRKTTSSGDKYAANFDLTVDIKDETGNELFDKVYKEELTTTNPETNYLSRNSKIIIKNYFLTPGKYKLTLSLFEPSTRRTSERSKEITIHDFLTPPLVISDVMIVAKLEQQGNRKSITPNVSRNVSSLDTTYLFFFVYRNNESPRIDINCRILNSKKEQVFTHNRVLDVSNGIDIQNQVIITVPVTPLPYDIYTVEISAATQTDSTSVSSRMDNTNKYFPSGLNNIDELIDELQYIATAKEMDYMRDGKTLTEKQKRFLDFWKTKNPNPLSQRNQIMDEYYKRLIYANKHFSTSFTKGWKTDMGMVYIIFGEPSEIERHPLEMNTKPYEVWSYYQLNREFVFVDYSGFGDYRLITPIWETFNYH